MQSFAWNSTQVCGISLKDIFSQWENVKWWLADSHLTSVIIIIWREICPLTWSIEKKTLSSSHKKDWLEIIQFRNTSTRQRNISVFYGCWVYSISSFRCYIRGKVNKRKCCNNREGSKCGIIRKVYFDSLVVLLAVLQLSFFGRKGITMNIILYVLCTQKFSAIRKSKTKPWCFKIRKNAAAKNKTLKLLLRQMLLPAKKAQGTRKSV